VILAHLRDHLARLIINRSPDLIFGRRAPPQMVLAGATPVTIWRRHHHRSVQRLVLRRLGLAARPREPSSAAVVGSLLAGVEPPGQSNILTWSCSRGCHVGLGPTRLSLELANQPVRLVFLCYFKFQKNVETLKNHRKFILTQKIMNNISKCSQK
jgi:hypothetical protein